MLTALTFAFVDSINLLLIGVIVAVGIAVPRATGATGATRSRYAPIAALLIAGDWLGVAGLALIMLLIFDGLGPVVQRFVEGPIFGVVLIVVGLATAFLALRGAGNSDLVDKIMRPLRAPNLLTVLTGVVLGVVQSATSVPFYSGLAVLSAAGIEPAVRYASLVLYATVALSLPTLSALLVGWVRARPGSTLGRGFAWARENPRTVASTATWSVAGLLVVLGVLQLA
ncbi:hypothetical protein [Corynebacterium timonense]|uniref:Sap, sulfolipid-1-addressing protein n=1 Tax=Corynebacterium timonense TaxID=441500 RepID=A0A1H1SHW7_9CORY|nr:hypothetical protein [Corynebacterium timonense]SDS47640.1 hypothetical protein SAMN04488539_1750 [Corynebacterium timonense]